MDHVGRRKCRSQDNHAAPVRPKQHKRTIGTDTFFPGHKMCGLVVGTSYFTGYKYAETVRK